MREKCKQCPSLIPASRMLYHLELKHNPAEFKPGDPDSAESRNDLAENNLGEHDEENDEKSDVLQNESLKLNTDEYSEASVNSPKKKSSDDSVMTTDIDEKTNALEKDSDLVLDQDSSVDSPGKVTSDVPNTNDLDEEKKSDSDDEIVPIRLSKRKRILDDEDETISDGKDVLNPDKKLIKDGVVQQDTKTSSEESIPEGFSACSYCSTKILTVELKTHMKNEHAWLDADLDENVTYGGSDLGEVDYEDLEVDYDEEGDDFFEDGNLADMQDVPVVDSGLFSTEQCDFCDETVPKSVMNEHLLKKHDINLPEDSEPVKSLELTPCPVCQVSTPVAVLPIHISHYHAGIGVMKDDGDNSKEKLSKDNNILVGDGEKDLVSLGEICEICDVRISAQKMVAHLDEVHDILVINEKLNESLQDETTANESTDNDPFAIPDFLKPKTKRPKFKCHHCQKKFSSRERVDIHAKNRHEGKWRCQVCVTYKLVQENRTIGIMKQLNKAAKGVKDDSIPVNDNIQSGQVAEIVYNYEDLYPEEEVEDCEECEDDFYWWSKEHSCEVTQANIRIVGGEKLKFVWADNPIEESTNVKSDFEYISCRLGRSFVDKASREVSTAYISEVVEDLVSAALDNNPFNSKADSGPTMSRYSQLKHQTEDQRLKLKSQILAYRYLKRKESLPNIVERVASYGSFKDSPLDEIRKLSCFFYKEYKEDIENEEKERFKKNDEAKKRLQEETLREMTTAKLYDYSKYFIPTIKAMKKAKKMQPKKEPKTPVLDSMMMNNNADTSGFKLPTGSALQMNDRNYLNKLKQHQEKTAKKLNMMQQGNEVNSKQYQDTMRELMVDNRRLENLNKAPSAMNPFRVKTEPGIKIEPGSLGVSSKGLRNIPEISIKKVATASQLPKVEVKKSSPALQRLQNLGLSISVGQNGRSRPVESVQPKTESGQSRPLSIAAGLKPKSEPDFNELHTSSSSMQPKIEFGNKKPYPGPVGDSIFPKGEPGLNRTYPGPSKPKSEPVLNSSVLEQYRQIAGIRQLEPPKPSGLWNASAKGREPIQNAKSLMPPPRQPFREQTLERTNYPPGVPSRQVQPPGMNGFNGLNFNRDKIRETFKKPSAPRPSELPRGHNSPLPIPRPSNLQKAEFTDSQKLQLKSQILAYRMLTRKERLPGIVKIAASNTNLKGMNIPKNEMRSLSNYFRQEYSGIV